MLHIRLLCANESFLLTSLLAYYVSRQFSLIRINDFTKATATRSSQ